MACRLFGAKPLSESVLAYCQLDPHEQTSVNLIKIQQLSYMKMQLETPSAKWQPTCFGFKVLKRSNCFEILYGHDDVIKWKHFPRYWSFVWGIHQSPCEFPSQRPVTRSFDVFFDLRLNKRLSKQPWGWWFETPSCSLGRHCNVYSLWKLWMLIPHLRDWMRPWRRLLWYWKGPSIITVTL